MNCHFSKASELLALCSEHALSICDITIAREIEESQASRDAILSRMTQYFSLMRESVKKGLAINELSPSGLSGGDAAKLFAY